MFKPVSSRLPLSSPFHLHDSHSAAFCNHGSSAYYWRACSSVFLHLFGMTSARLLPYLSEKKSHIICHQQTALKQYYSMQDKKKGLTKQFGRDVTPKLKSSVPHTRCCCFPQAIAHKLHSLTSSLPKCIYASKLNISHRTAPRSCESPVGQMG